jgi:hypothetical protein
MAKTVCHPYYSFLDQKIEADWIEKKDASGILDLSHVRPNVLDFFAAWRYNEDKKRLTIRLNASHRYSLYTYAYYLPSVNHTPFFVKVSHSRLTWVVFSSPDANPTGVIGYARAVLVRRGEIG